MIFLIQIVINAIVIALIAFLLPGLGFEGSWWLLIIAGAVTGLFNFLLKPLLKFILPSFFYITLAVFTLLINVSLLIIIGLWVPEASITGLSSALWAVIIVSLTNYSIHTIIDYK